jgi:hypothetical protein
MGKGGPAPGSLQIIVCIKENVLMKFNISLKLKKID